MDEVYRSFTPVDASVYNWVNKFKLGRTSTQYEPRSRTPVEVTNTGCPIIEKSNWTSWVIKSGRNVSILKGNIYILWRHCKGALLRGVSEKSRGDNNFDFYPNQSRSPSSALSNLFCFQTWKNG